MYNLKKNDFLVDLKVKLFMDEEILVILYVPLWLNKLQKHFFFVEIYKGTCISFGMYPYFIHISTTNQRIYSKTKKTYHLAEHKLFS
jgi:hypothetical protein